jgi:hypothetical protein
MIFLKPRQYTANYKILQAAFNKLNIAKTMELERLTRGKYQDNLEFMQWFKGFCSKHRYTVTPEPNTHEPNGFQPAGMGFASNPWRQKHLFHS